MEIKTLGPLEITSGERLYTPSGTKMRQMLALLLSNANSVVSTDSITEELWGDDPPRSVHTTLQTYIYKLRKDLVREFPGDALENALVTRAPGYKLAVPPERIDATAFERMAREGRLLLQSGRPAEALETLTAAIGLWSGDVMENVQSSRRLQSHALRLQELRIESLQLRIKAKIELGRCHELIPELRALAEEYPLNEWFHGQLMYALTRSGRRSEALDAYQRLRTILGDELGLEPSNEIQRLQLEILRDDGDMVPIG
ncbi:AfsR/SARP family transcriptional regulator [Streptomonospora sp. PA3]|uniref:AfsR/SARP family transcriptional regulator n=1 Tax=Streptomonospora sp. PA3 TaxID=2607326 RepID=UPI0012DFE393|nr:AfsR/SARP family transcriptional regulator [Streptomonospora sp. PA3]MUL41483.1 AfsR/SARP family transcriptional regulator [Streptomonospora sp. PA3]